MKKKNILVSLSIIVFLLSLLIPKPTFAQGVITSCEADINESGQVDLVDYTLLVANFLLNPFSVLRTDINSDGKVDLRDYTHLVRFFFQNCTAQQSYFNPLEQYYASPNGTSQGDGSSNNPWDLATAMTKTSQITAGDVLWLKEGAYGTGVEKYDVNFAGTSSQPVFIRGEIGKRVTFNGGFRAYGKFVNFWGFEITNNTNRISAGVESDRVGGIEMRGEGQKIINMVFSHVGHPAIGFWDQVGDGGEIYGTLIWGTGGFGSGSTAGAMEGSGIYAQNQTGKRYISDVISFRNFTSGMKALSAGSSWANGFNFNGNIIFDNNLFNLLISARSNPITGLVLQNNSIYQRINDNRRNVRFGYYDEINNDLTLSDNTFVNGADEQGIFFKQWTIATINNNKFINTGVGNMIEFEEVSSANGSNNDYYSHFRSIWINNITTLNFTNWSNLFSETGSQLTLSLPTSNQIRIRENKYEPGRANIAVYNWEKLDEVSVSLSGIVEPGQSFEIRDAQNFYGNPILTGTYQGGQISLPMYLKEVEPVFGDNIIEDQFETHTAPEFAAFVVLSGDQRLTATSTTTYPEFSINGIEVPQGTDSISLTSEDGATIYYTLDGSVPTESATLYSGPIAMSSNTQTITAKAYKNSKFSSPTIAKTFYRKNLTDQLVGYYQFNENSGSTVSSQVANLGSGTITGATWTTGISGSALQFDGVDDYVYVGTSANIPSFSVTFWAKAQDKRGVAVGNGSSAWSATNYVATLDPIINQFKSSQGINTSSAGVNSSECTDQGEWNHYVIAFDSTSRLNKIYCNGIEVASSTLASGTVGSGNRLAFGRLGNYASSDYFKGTLDEVRIYSRALNAYEISSLAKEYSIN